MDGLGFVTGWGGTCVVLALAGLTSAVGCGLSSDRRRRSPTFVFAASMAAAGAAALGITASCCVAIAASLHLFDPGTVDMALRDMRHAVDVSSLAIVGIGALAAVAGVATWPGRVFWAEKEPERGFGEGLGNQVTGYVGSCMGLGDAWSGDGAILVALLVGALLLPGAIATRLVVLGVWRLTGPGGAMSRAPSPEGGERDGGGRRSSREIIEANTPRVSRRG